MKGNSTYSAIAGEILRQWEFSVDLVAKKGIKGLTSDTRKLPYMLPRSRGMSPINAACDSAIRQFGLKWRLESDDTLRHRISKHDAEGLAAKAFGGLLDNSELRCASESISDEMIRSLNKFKNDWGSITFHFPCSLTQNPAPTEIERFSIGPVCFAKRIDWAHRIDKSSSPWMECLALKLEGKNPDRSLDPENTQTLDDALRYLRNCAWIASVTIDGHHEKMAKQKAALLFKLALYAIGIRLSASDARDIQSNAEFGETSMEFRITGDPGHKLAVEWTKTWLGRSWTPDQFKNWIDSNMNFFDATGVALDRISSQLRGSSTHEPAGRWVDALYAFGQARQSESPALAIVNYAIVLDTLTLGGKARRVTELLRLLYGRKSEEQFLTDGSTTRTFVERLYNAGRSRYAHGTSSLLMDDAPLPLVTADRVTAMTLFNYILFLRESGWQESHAAFFRWLEKKHPGDHP